MPRSVRPAITTVRRYWSLARARNDASTTEPPFGPPLPSGPWQPAHAAAYTPWPRPASPGEAAYEGRAEGFTAPPLPHVLTSPVTRASTWASVSAPPALIAKAGWSVPVTPFAITLRRRSRGTSARSTGSLRAREGPSRPAAPGQAAQLPL